MMKSLRAGLAALATLAMMGASAGAVAEDYPDITFRYATGFPEAVYMNGPAIYFAEELEKRSGGKIKVKLFFGGTLGKSNEILDLVAKGAVDMGSVVQGYFTRKIPTKSPSTSRTISSR